MELTSILIYAAIIVAFTLFAAAEVFTQYRKFQLKKQYIQELDDYKNSKKRDGDDEERSESR